MSATVEQLVDLLREHPGITCTEIGERLWPDRRRSAKRQSYARPAGKLCQRAIELGLITADRTEDGRRRVFYAKGRRRGAGQ